MQLKENFDTRTKAHTSTNIAVVFEAEDMKLHGDVSVGEDPTAFGGKYIEFR